MSKSAENLAILADKLEAQGKINLAQAMRRGIDMNARQYAQEFFKYSPSVSMEPALSRAFEKELKRVGVLDSEIFKTLEFLKKNRIIQTAPHLGLCPTPRMFTIDWLMSLGLPKDAFYIIAAFPGVSFSNSFSPGVLKMEQPEERINFIPTTRQNDLVYRSEIPEKMANLTRNLTSPLNEFFPVANIGDSFSAYAVNSYQKILKHILKAPIQVIDASEVITTYLLEVINDPNHFISKILFNQTSQEKLVSTFPNNIIWFFARYQNGKYTEQESLTLKDGILTGKHLKIPFNQETVRNGLSDGTLCPATFLMYTVFSFLNHFLCLGSFLQAEYLPLFKEYYQKSNLFAEKEIDSVPAVNLSTATFDSSILGLNTQILDIILGKHFEPDPNTDMADLWLPMADLLLSQDQKTFPVVYKKMV